MTYKTLTRIIKQIKYKDWFFYLEERKDCFVLQIRFVGPDSYTGKDKIQHCRKWFVSSHACKAEVVRTAFKAVLAAEEHEAGEFFRYKGVPINSPHLNPDAVSNLFLSEQTPYNKRRKQK